MANNDPPVTGSFYQLLLSDPMTTVVNSSSSPDYSESFYGPNPPKMLCFGGYQKEEEAICSEITAATATIKQMVSQSDSSSASSANNNSKSSSANPNRKRNGLGKNPVTELVGLAGSPAESKRARSEKQTIHANMPKPRPARKEKIGDRIATLQQLVSPFGKTDTASVLQEAMCYIRFLHEQVQVLCSPYLNQSSSNQETVRLRSMGLCLVPVACTAQVASTNGADFWAPAGMDQNGISCSLASSKQNKYKKRFGRFCENRMGMPSVLDYQGPLPLATELDIIAQVVGRSMRLTFLKLEKSFKRPPLPRGSVRNSELKDQLQKQKEEFLEMKAAFENMIQILEELVVRGGSANLISNNNASEGATSYGPAS